MNDIKSICRLLFLSDEGAFGTCIFNHNGHNGFFTMGTMAFEATKCL